MILHHAGFLCLGLAFVLAMILTPPIMRLARIFGFVDLPGVRKVHSSPIPRVGGVAIALATILSFGLIAMITWPSMPAGPQYTPILTLAAISLVAMGMGLIDDLANIRASYKLLILLLAAGLLCCSGGVIHGFIFHGQMIWRFGLASWPITVLWIAGVAVSVNFVDGLDGLAAGIVAIACGVLAFCAIWSGDIALAMLPLALCGALLAFLRFNFNPARVFMGDSGSMFLGVMLAGSCVIAQSKIGTTRGLLLPGLALAIPFLDAIFTFVRRGVLQRRSLFSAERGHIHHRLLDIGLCHRHVVLLLWGVTLLSAGVSVISLWAIPWVTGISALAYFAGLVALIRLAGTVRARETMNAVRRNRALSREKKRYRDAFEEMQLFFHEAKTFEGWWQQVCRAAEKLDFARMDLPLVRRDGSKSTLRWRRGELVEADSMAAEIPIPQRRVDQNLRMDVRVRVSEFLESAGQRLALFSRLMGDCNPRMLPDAIGNSTGPQSGSEEFPDPAYAETARQRAAQASPLPRLRVAFVHDFLYTYAGAERVLEQMLAMFPQADLFSLFDFLPDHLRGFIQNKPVTTTFIQKLPGARWNHRIFLPLMPLAIEQLDVSAYDVVISSSYVAAKGVLTRPDQLHICYCHTPVRCAWDLQNLYLGGRRTWPLSISGAIARILLHYIRNWDVRSSNNVDVFIANSNFVGRRIQKIYRRDAVTIHPPVDTDWFTLSENKEDFYVTASRLVSYKRVDLIVEAFRQLPDRRLFVIGEGPEMEALRLKAPANVHLMGYQSAKRLRQYMQRAKAFVFAAEEDFGIVPVEAQACGTPVIAFGRGGATESVIPGQTGVLFDEQTPESLVAAIIKFESQQWDPATIRKNAERFSISQFRQRLSRLAKANWEKFDAVRSDPWDPDAAESMKPSARPQKPAESAAASIEGIITELGSA